MGLMAEANLVTEEHRPMPQEGDHSLQRVIRGLEGLKGLSGSPAVLEGITGLQRQIAGMGSQYLSENEVTSANVDSLYDGHADVTPILDKGGQAAKAFNVTPETTWVRTDRMITHKNQNDDPKYKAGKKVHPVTTAAKFMGQVIDKGGKKRDPIQVVNNGDGTYDVIDGNATTQAAMMAGWQKLPVEIVEG